MAYVKDGNIKSLSLNTYRRVGPRIKVNVELIFVTKFVIICCGKY